MTQTLEAPAILPENTPPPQKPGPFAVAFNRDELVEALSALAPCVRNRDRRPSPIAVLSCVKLSTEDGVVTLEATDRELWASRTVAQVQVIAVGSMLVNYDDLKEAVKELSGQTLTIESDADTVRVYDAEFGYDLAPAAIADFPPPLKGSASPAGTVAAAGLARLYKQTDAARYDGTAGQNAIRGFSLSAQGDRIRCSTTDGRRLHDATAQWNAKPGELPACVVPAGVLKAATTMAGEEGDVAVAVTDEDEAGRITFSGDGWELSGPLVAGTFPPVDGIIPKDCPNVATAGRESLLSLFRRGAALLRDDPHVRCDWDMTGLSLSASKAVRNRGASLQPMALKYAGKPLTIGLNAKFIIDALSAADSTEVTVSMTAPNHPILIEAGPDFLAMCMPVNLQ